MRPKKPTLGAVRIVEAVRNRTLGMILGNRGNRGNRGCALSQVTLEGTEQRVQRT